MGMDFRIDDTRRAAVTAGERPIRLSGRVLGQLCGAEQLVVWALRETASSDAAAGERLAHGFRLAFGDRLLGAAACGFDGLRRCLGAEPSLAPRLCPLHCACLGVDEELLLQGLAAAQIGDRALHDSLLSPFVLPTVMLQLWRQSRLFSTAMGEVCLVLPDSRLARLRPTARRH